MLVLAASMLVLPLAMLVVMLQIERRRLKEPGEERPAVMSGALIQQFADKALPTSAAMHKHVLPS